MGFSRLALVAVALAAVVGGAYALVARGAEAHLAFALDTRRDHLVADVRDALDDAVIALGTAKAFSRATPTVLPEAWASFVSAQNFHETSPGVDCFAIITDGVPSFCDPSACLTDTADVVKAAAGSPELVVLTTAAGEGLMARSFDRPGDAAVARVRFDALFHGAFGGDDFDVRITAGDHVLYERGRVTASPWAHDDVVQVGAQTWHIATAPGPALLDATASREPLFVLLGGTLASLTALGALALRARVLARVRAREAEHARLLAASEANYRAFFDSVEDLLFVLDEHGHILHLNDAVLRRLGFSREELLGRSIVTLVPAELKAQGLVDARALKAGPTAVSHLPLLTKAGVRMPAETRAVSGTWNGRPALFGIVKDLTELAQSEQRFTSVFANNPFPMALSSEAHYVDVNDAFLTTFGLTREQVVGRHVEALNLFPDPRQRAEAMAVLQRDGQLEHFPVDVRAPDGSVRHGLLWGQLLHLGGKPMMLTVMLDITQRVQAERAAHEARREAEVANQAKTAFLGLMSHELRTPIHGVLGLAEVLKGTTLTSEQRDTVGTMTMAGEQLLTLLTDVLDFSQLESGAVTLEEASFDAGQPLREVVGLLEPRAAARGLRLVLEPADLPRVVGDATRVRQVLTNLVGNAVKFTNQGEVRLRARVVSADGASFTLRFEVQDTGLGVPLEDQPQLFKAFTLGDMSSTRRHGGPGLGLAISRKLVDLMHGRIGADSTPGKGSTFWFELKLGVGPVATPLTPQPSYAPLSGVVLLADDNPINLHVAQKLLARFGLQVVTATNGREALERVKAGPRVDLVLMDVQMPELDGLGATRAIRQWEQDAHTPVVALTANAFAADRRACLEAGMDDFLSKPLNQHQLALVLERWLADQGTATVPEWRRELRLDERRLARKAEQLEVAPQVALELLLAGAPGALDALEATVTAADAANLNRLARALHGTCDDVGALRLAALTWAVSHAAREGDQARALTLLGAARAELNALQENQGAR